MLAHALDRGIGVARASRRFDLQAVWSKGPLWVLSESWVEESCLGTVQLGNSFSWAGCWVFEKDKKHQYSDKNMDILKIGFLLDPRCINPGQTCCPVHCAAIPSGHFASVSIPTKVSSEKPARGPF